MSYSNMIPQFYQQPIIFTDLESEQLSKLRIIQKNLVHFQNFPDYLYNQSLLLSPEYFGQYGNITKIFLSSKIDKITKKKTNSAYLTFETKEQAAYCILSVDSIKLDDFLVRAFFGTTKYCNHFLKNYHCFNENKCMFLHYLAEQSDIISENSKFGYSEHIKLAKKIIGFGSFQSKYYVMNCKVPTNHMLPSIKTIYYKEDIVAKSKNHKRKISDSSQHSTRNNSSNDSKGKKVTKNININLDVVDKNNNNNNNFSSKSSTVIDEEELLANNNNINQLVNSTINIIDDSFIFNENNQSNNNNYENNNNYKNDNNYENKSTNNYENKSNNYYENNCNKNNYNKNNNNEKYEVKETNSYNSSFCFDLYQPKNKSRFFNVDSNEEKYNISENINIIINNLIRRFSFFNIFKKYSYMQKINDNLEINYCEELFKKTKDKEIKDIIDKNFN